MKMVNISNICVFSRGSVPQETTAMRKRVNEEQPGVWLRPESSCFIKTTDGANEYLCNPVSQESDVRGEYFL